jgi:hypothetical protein
MREIRTSGSRRGEAAGQSGPAPRLLYWSDRDIRPVGSTTKDTKSTKMEFDAIPNRVIGCAIEVCWFTVNLAPQPRCSRWSVAASV